MQKVSLELSGHEYALETGLVAKQASSVIVRCGETVVLVTAVASKNSDPDKPFFPLFVEYREKKYAAGMIPGGYFKREARPSEKEVLNCRLVDRPIRPLFPEGYMAETQVVATVLSFDQENDADVLAITGASAALNLSDIPFNDVLAGVRVCRVDGTLKVNPTIEEALDSDLNLIVAGTETATLMIEGDAGELSEDEMIEAIQFAHENIRQLITLQKELIEKCGGTPTKREFIVPEMPEGMLERVQADYGQAINEAGRVLGKGERQSALDDVRQRMLTELAEVYEDQEKWLKTAFGKIEKELMRKMILEESIRSDGRSLDQVRAISIENSFLPRTHGSTLFTRGETQALVAVTLGTSRDEQRIDNLEGEYFKRFMLHYNFPGFSVGEVGRFFTGRREIGHGNLAERSLHGLLPEEDSFPYTLRVVSDIMESNGSSSMATVCGGSLALMDAGVPIKSHVAGVAMGLITDGERFRILTDIQGLEDHLGDMDFKVAGTRKGITAFQLDTKIEGLPEQVMRDALAQARDARMHILGLMEEALPAARTNVSKYAPKITSIKIPVAKIRDIIGKGGVTIRKIQEETGATIEVEDDGTVKIAAVNGESGDAAIEWISYLTAEPEIDKIYDGKVKTITKFGAFVEILPGQDGLLHISEIDHKRIDRVEDVFQVGDAVQVKVVDIDNQGKIRLSRKVLLEQGE
ncbi:MAG: polyribonucleotide nucleotidyltransferase [bacterium]|nr:polyribonucleotide nucleotidyltransferase [bacterium]